MIDRLALGAQFVGIGIAVLLIGQQISDSFIEETRTVPGATIESSLRVTDSPAQALEVKEAIGDPEPLEQSLQGAPNSTQQDASAVLQKPRTSDQLQPNAKLPDFPAN